MSKNSCNSCKHCNNSECEYEETSKIDISLYIISIVLFAISFLPILNNYKVWVYLAIIILSGYKLIFNGIINIFRLNFEEDTLMSIASIAAFILGEYPESCMVILLFKLGEFLEDKAVEGSNKNVEDIVKIKSQTANILDNNMDIKVVDVEDVKIGDKILIKPGEMVPLDCKIVSGNSSLNMSNITGESVSVDVFENQSILSGSINLNGSLTCVVEKDYNNSTASQIVDLVFESKNNKAKTEEFITKFSKIYTPIVIIIACLIAIFIPVISGQEFKIWIMRALVFLVASCPCSIVISVPLAFFSCIGTVSKKGMLIKGTKHIENLAQAKYVVFDKTGTITTGKMKIDSVCALNNYTKEEILKYMYALEKNSNHPISTAIKIEIEKEKIDVNYDVTDCKEIPGYGIQGKIAGKEILFGNYKLLEEKNIKFDIKDASYLVIDANVVGYITFDEELRESAKDIKEKLEDINIKEMIMLTGDNEKNANKIASKVGILKVFSNLLPKEKLENVKMLKESGKVIFIGDGINDSPVIAESSFGVAMGEGTEIASSVADGILMSNNLDSIPFGIKVSRKTMNIVKFNITFSLVIKFIVLTLGILGYAPIWLAVIADTGVSLLTVLNSIRIFKN